ncbi:MAG: AI-2E family transporter [Clostridia bacterium]|nr:AI-2E family transporter [Clostridia bacterium]
MKKKYLHIGVTAFGVVCACILFFFLLFKAGTIFEYVGTILSYLMPIAYGIVLAYLLLPLNNWLKKKFLSAFSKKIKKEKRALNTAKALSTTISILFALVVIVGLAALIFPQVWESVKSIANTLPDKLNAFSNWLNNVFKNHPKAQEFVTSAIELAVQKLRDFASGDTLIDRFPEIMSSLSTGLWGIVDFLENIIIGIIIAIYVLNSTDLFAAQAKKLAYSFFKVKTANTIIHNFRYTHKMIGGFLNGRLLDSLIIGIMCFIGMKVLSMPYALLISVVVGITNIIPFFGPFIGAIPSILLIFTVDPKKAFWFLVFIVALQQFDGNILGPKISSNLTGLSGFWVMFALLLFGGLFGVWGMLLGVPIFAVIKTLIAEFINRRLKGKSLPTTTYSYMTTGYVEPIVTTQSGEVVDNDDETDDTDKDDEHNDGESSSTIFKAIKNLSNKISKKFKK